uniref:Dihydroflavanol 4-reductase n=1 Tax=Heterorhabditis bacteriophora TaxID=37862 RepID=A0A1I7XJK4_HETBA
MECLRAAPYCDMKEIFKTISSSVHYLCHEKAVPFSKMEKCLTGEVDAVMHSLSIFVTHFYVYIIYRKYSLNCLLSCLTPELNKVCPLSGWLTLDVLLKPLESVADILERVSTQLKNLISKKLDKRCHFIMNKEELLQLRKGKFVMH